MYLMNINETTFQKARDEALETVQYRVFHLPLNISSRG